MHRSIWLSLALGGLVACSPTVEEVVVEEIVETQDDAPAPGTDISIFALDWIDGAPVLGERTGGISRPGYDNQPYFTPDGTALLYASDDESGNTDIWSLDLVSGETTNLTNTPEESEYSPRYTPDGNHLSFIHQPPGGYGGQVFVAGQDGSEPQAFMEYGPLGYYAFNQAMNQLVVFALSEEANTLQHVDLRNAREAVTVLSDHQGRALYSSPIDDGVFFTQSREDEGFSVYQLNFATKATREHFDLPGLSQDYAVFSADIDSDHLIAFIAASDGALYYRSLDDLDWTMIADLDVLGITGTTRMAVNDDASRIAIVLIEAQTP